MDVKKVDSEATWSEDMVVEVEDNVTAEQNALAVIDYFNNTLKPGESQREVVNVHTGISELELVAGLVKNNLGEYENMDVNYDNDTGTYEVIFEDIHENGTLMLSCNELMNMNRDGLVYVGEQTGIDYEMDNGNMLYMDIYYFQFIQEIYENPTI